jgi:hypothetical protein
MGDVSVVDVRTQRVLYVSDPRMTAPEELTTEIYAAIS